MVQTREITLSVLAETREERGRRVQIEKGVMDLNQQFAASNRARLHRGGIKTLNILSSPGSGKTTLLARTLHDLAQEFKMAVIVGDLATDNDAEALCKGGGTAVQIQTGTLCHLEAAMIARALDMLDLSQVQWLFIENVGNLVCPASFDLGEDAKVVLFSSTEGEDKPLKYAPMFYRADVVILSKSDIAGAAGFDRTKALENLRRVAPKAQVLEVSARTGTGMEAWYSYLRQFSLP